MKKYLVLVVALFLVGCGNQKKEKTETTVESTVETKEKTIPLKVSLPEYNVDGKTFTIKGTATPEGKISIDGLDDKTEVVANPNGEFEFEAEIPADELEIVISDGKVEEKIQIKSIAILLAEIEAEEKEAERIRKEEEAAEKERLEQEGKAKEDKRIADEKKAAEQEKQNKIDNASREHRNALNTARDYLDYTSFSKSGLYDQLIFEGYPADAAQFAIDNIQVDWNSQALNTAIDYLDYSSFSDQGLYDQLIFEGFSAEQAQYAIDNLPE